MNSFLWFLCDKSSKLSAQFNDFVRHTHLDNGIQFASQRRFMDQKLRFNVKIRTGSLDNPEDKSGLAHFLEHLLYDTDAKNRFNEKGGFINARTGGHEMSFYGYLDNTPENAEFLTDTIRDFMTTPVKQDAYEREMRRIRNETGAYMDNANFVHSSMLKNAFSGASYAFDDLGDPEKIKDITLEDLNAFKDKWFVGPNTIITMTGVSNHGQMHKQLNEALQDVPATPTPEHKTSTFNPIELREDNASVHQLYVSMNFPVEPADMHQKILHSLAKDCTLRMMDKRFSDETGLVYAINTGGLSFTDKKGNFEIKTSMIPEHADEFIPDLTKILATAATNLDPDLLEREKQMWIDDLNSRKSVLPIAYHSVDDLGSDLANYGRPLTVEEEIDLVDSITHEDVQDYIKGIIENQPALIAYGNSEKLHSRDEFTAMLEQEMSLAQEARPAEERNIEIT